MQIRLKWGSFHGGIAVKEEIYKIIKRGFLMEASQVDDTIYTPLFMKKIPSITTLPTKKT